MINKDNKRRIGIYGVNFLTPSLIRFLQNTPKVSKLAEKIENGLPGLLDKVGESANPYGAMFFGALDIVGKLSPKIKNNKLITRLPKLLGAGYYGVNTIIDLFSIAEGDYASFIDLSFNASMAYQLGKDTMDNYKNRDLWDDITEW